MNWFTSWVGSIKRSLVPTTKEAFELAVAVIILLVVSRLSYIEGMKDEQFDRDHANLLLQNCIDVKKHNEGTR